MNIKILKGRKLPLNLEILEGQIYEVIDIVETAFKIEIPMKRKGFSKYALVADKDAEMLDD